MFEHIESCESKSLACTNKKKIIKILRFWPWGYICILYYKINSVIGKVIIIIIRFAYNFISNI